MSKSYRRCEICHIQEAHAGKGLFFSCFPIELNRCRAWLKATGNQELVWLPIEKLHKQRNICANHFSKKDFNKKGNRLKRHAIPTLNLTAPPLTESQLAEFPQHVASYYKTGTSDLSSKAGPSTSHQTRNILMEISENVPVPKQPAVMQQAGLSKDLVPIQNPPVPVPKQPAVMQQAGLSKDQVPIQNPPEFTPRERKLVEQLQRTKCTLSSLRRSANAIEKLRSDVLREIVAAAMKNQKRKLKGRRWSAKHKISALAIFKRSPKAYKYLRHVIPLPSIKTLHNVLKKIPMGTGINKAILDHLTHIASKKNIKDKYCGLVFDEISLKRRLLYDVTTDKVEGYEDFGMDLGRTSQLADHALVFMLQGIRAKFKQPLAFYFVKGTVSSQKLAALIKKIIHAVEETGFRIITTICDQGPTNMGALKLLRTWSAPYDRTANYFLCNDKKVYMIYDVPHLFKSIRNNFQNYGIISMGGLQARWEHLLKVEEQNRNILYLSKITPMHVEPKYRAKMKVKLAAQILSNTVAAVLKLISQAQTDPRIATEMMQSGLLIADLDRLFDKTNGPSGPDDVKKGRRENVSTKTDHIAVWAEYRAKLENMVFKNNNGIRAKNVRCIEGYLITLKSFRDIWTELNSAGFKYLNLRALNQDALENLFGIIRQHSPTNRNTTCFSFIGALKTTVVSGMTAPHNKNFNCENDYKELLTDFHDLVFAEKGKEDHSSNKSISLGTKQVRLSESDSESLDQDIPVLSIPDFETIEADLAGMEQQPVVYVSGYIASSILKSHKCLTCEKFLKLDNPPDDPIYNYIHLREWWAEKRSLTYPTKELCRLVEVSKTIFENDILPCLHHENICNLSVTIFMAQCDTSFINCDEHNDSIKNIIFNKMALLLIRRQCSRINQKVIIEEESIADANKKAQQAGIAK